MEMEPIVPKDDEKEEKVEGEESPKEPVVLFSTPTDQQLNEQSSIYTYKADDGDEVKEKTKEDLVRKEHPTESDQPKKRQKTENEEEVQQQQQQQPKKTPCIYVTGLPPAISHEDCEKFFSKCGILRENNEHQPNIRFYRNEDGSLKGDCLVEYLQVISVDLALKILDETEIAPGYPVKIQPAQFKGKIKKKKRMKTYQHSKLKWTLNDDDLDWKLRSVIIKNMFSPDEFREDPTFAVDLKSDLKIECEKNCGAVERIRVFPNNPEGVVHVIFKYQYSATQCINLMNGRFFSKKKLVCYLFDGKDYRIKESKEDEFKRLQELCENLGK